MIYFYIVSPGVVVVEEPGEDALCVGAGLDEDTGGAGGVLGDVLGGVPGRGLQRGAGGEAGEAEDGDGDQHGGGEEIVTSEARPGQLQL